MKQIKFLFKRYLLEERGLTANTVRTYQNALDKAGKIYHRNIYDLDINALSDINSYVQDPCTTMFKEISELNRGSGRSAIRHFYEMKKLNWIPTEVNNKPVETPALSEDALNKLINKAVLAKIAEMDTLLEEEEVEEDDEVLKVTKIVKEEATVDPLNAAIAEMLQPHDTYFANQQRKYKLEYSALSGPNSQLKKHSDLAWFFQKIMKEQSSNRDKLGFEQDMHRVIFAAKNSTSHKGSGKEREIRTVIVEAAAKMLKIYNS